MGIVHLLFSMKNAGKTPRFLQYFHSSSLGCCKTGTSSSREEPWVSQVCEAVSWDTQQIRALFNPLEITSGGCPYGFTAPAQQCWRQDVSAEMVQTFLWMLWIHWAEGGRVETIAVLWKDPELWKGYHYSYPSARAWAAAGKLLTDRILSCLFWNSDSQSANLGDCPCPSPAASWDPHFLGFHFPDASKGGCGVSSALVWGRFAGRVKYCGWRTLSWCDLFNSWKM